MRHIARDGRLIAVILPPSPAKLQGAPFDVDEFVRFCRAAEALVSVDVLDALENATATLRNMIAAHQSEMPTATLRERRLTLAEAERAVAKMRGAS